MSKKWWTIFSITQLVGIALALYTMRFEVGASAVADWTWVPAMVMLSPGMWLVEGLLQITGSHWLGFFYGAPAFFCTVVVVNAACWRAVSLIISRVVRRLA